MTAHTDLSIESLRPSKNTHKYIKVVVLHVQFTTENYSGLSHLLSTDFGRTLNAITIDVYFIVYT